MGGSVRGEKDYSVIITTGPDLTRLVRDKNSRLYMSNQTDTQIEIGLEIARMGKQDIEEGKTPKDTLDLIRQSLRRDSGWKAFYAEQMDAVRPSGANESVLQVYASELAAEQKYRSGDYAGAAQKYSSFLTGIYGSSRSGVVFAGDGSITLSFPSFRGPAASDSCLR